MPGNVYLESSACVMKNGHLLFGTNHGLVVVDPEKSHATACRFSGGSH